MHIFLVIILEFLEGWIAEIWDNANSHSRLHLIFEDKNKQNIA